MDIMLRNRKARAYSRKCERKRTLKLFLWIFAILFIQFVIIVLLFTSDDSVETLGNEHASNKIGYFERFAPFNCKLSNDFIDINNSKEFTEAEIDLIARVVMSESSIEPYECKMLVAKTVLNRYDSDKYDSISDVIFDPYQFSTQDNGDVTEECYNAVYDAFLSDEPVMYFRTDYYHSYGEPYKQVGITCFSTE